jgi:hypothetical protein
MQRLDLGVWWHIVPFFEPSRRLSYRFVSHVHYRLFGLVRKYVRKKLWARWSIKQIRGLFHLMGRLQT